MFATLALIAVPALALPLAQEPAAPAPARQVLKVPAGAHEPELAVDDGGRVALTVATPTEVYALVSADRGRSFGAPILVGSAGALSVGARRGPKVVFAGEALCIAAIGGKEGKGRDGDVLAWSSKDQGATWSAATRVNKTAGGAAEGLHALASGPAGQVFCVWIDVAQKPPQVLGALSTDGGASFGAERRISGPTGSILCPCCSPSAAYEKDGTLHVSWRGERDGARDIVLASSKNGFETPAKEAPRAGTSTWKIQMCPMDGGAVRAAGDDALIAWRSAADVLLASPRQLAREERVGGGLQPALGIGVEAHVVWSERRGGKLWARRYGKELAASAAVELAPRATLAVVAGSPTRGKGPVLAAFETSYDADRELVLVRLED